MASISKDKKGNRRILFAGVNGTRDVLYCQKAPLRADEALRSLVEDLVTIAKTGQPLEPHTLEKINSLHPAVRARFEKLGLLGRNVTRTQKTIRVFVSEHVATRTKVKPATKEIWRQGEKSLLEFFAADRKLVDVTPGDADEYLEHLRGTSLAPLTILKRLRFAKTIFRAATRKKLIPTDPFVDVSFVASKPDKGFFITREMTDTLVGACPDHHWRMIVLLCRYGGLRCPSEVLSLRWQDIRWAENQITVQSPKTEHHPGKESRLIPLFPELRRQLEECFERAPEGAEYIIDARYRRSCMGKAGWRNCNLRTRFEKIISTAGLTKWPRLFHNLRSSRQTELAEAFPSHVVCSWMGNSEDIARKHYYQVTDAHFAAAAGVPDTEEPSKRAVATVPQAKPQVAVVPKPARSRNAESDALVTQKATQHTAAPKRTKPTDATEYPGVERLMRLYAELCGSVRNTSADGVGFALPP